MSLQITGQAQGLVVPIAQKSGQANSVSMGWNNEFLVSELIPRFTAMVLTGNVYTTTFPVAATAAASATSTGAFALFNPGGSGKNLVLLNASAFINAPAAATTTYAVGMVAVANQNPTATTPNANGIFNLLVGSQLTSAGKAFTAGTLVGAPTTVARTSFAWYADLAASSFSATINDQIDGAVVIAPNSGVDFVSFAGTPSIGLSVTWAELPA